MATGANQDLHRHRYRGYPGTYEVEDGVSALVDAQNFQESGGKTGLSFRLVNQCQAYLAGEKIAQGKNLSRKTIYTALGP